MATHLKSALAGYTVSADLLRGFTACAVKCGVPRDRLAYAVDDGEQPNIATRHSAEHLYRLWEQFVRLSGDPIIGYRMAFVAEPKTFGVLGQIMARCSTLLDAFRQLERFSAIAYQGSRFSVLRDPSTVEISADVEARDSPAQTTILLWVVTNLALLPHRLTGVDVRPRRVECTARPPRALLAKTLRERWPMAFDAPSNRVVFDARICEMPIHSADVDLKLLLAQVIEEHLQKLGKVASFEEGLSTVLRRMMNGTMPTLEALSARTGMSERTLQRRLKGANTSFQKLLRRVLHEASDELLGQGNLSQGEIAFILGYSEASAFSHAYRSWTGHAPGAGRTST
jgi:AraC-like DNA-binding protein